MRVSRYLFEALVTIADGLTSAAMPSLIDVSGIFRLMRSSTSVDERVTKLSSIQKDLEAAIDAVKSLREEADNSKEQNEQLKQSIQQLQEDKKAAEEVIKVPEEAFGRLVQRATSRGRVRGWIEGAAIGLATGFISSILATWAWGRFA